MKNIFGQRTICVSVSTFIASLSLFGCGGQFRGSGIPVRALSDAESQEIEEDEDSVALPSQKGGPTDLNSTGYDDDVTSDDDKRVAVNEPPPSGGTAGMNGGQQNITGGQLMRGNKNDNGTTTPSSVTAGSGPIVVDDPGLNEDPKPELIMASGIETKLVSVVFEDASDNDYDDLVYCFDGAFKVDTRNSLIQSLQDQTVKGHFQFRATYDNRVSLFKKDPKTFQNTFFIADSTPSSKMPSTLDLSFKKGDFADVGIWVDALNQWIGKDSSRARISVGSCPVDPRSELNPVPSPPQTAGCYGYFWGSGGDVLMNEHSLRKDRWERDQYFDQDTAGTRNDCYERAHEVADWFWNNGDRTMPRFIGYVHVGDNGNATGFWFYGDGQTAGQSLEWRPHFK